METIPTHTLSPDPASDEALTERVQAQDESALASLMHRHTPLLRTVISRVVHNEADTDDLLQEVFIEFWNRSSSYDPVKGKLLGWLVTLARRRAIDRVRRRQAYDRAEERCRLEQDRNPLRSHVTLPEHEAHDSQRITLEVMRRCLPDAQVRCVSMAFLSGLSQREIAAKTGIPLGTIKTRLELGLRKLRTALCESGVHSSDD